MDLQDPTAKMSKTAASDAGLIQLLDDPASIARKFRRASPTPRAPCATTRRQSRGSSNLLEILGSATGHPPLIVADGYTQYGPLKADAGDAVIELLTPIQDRYRQLLADRGQLAAIMRHGAAKAREVASATLDRAYTNIGLLSA